MESKSVALKYLPEHDWFLPAIDNEFEDVLKKFRSTDTEQFESRIPELSVICDNGMVIDVGAYVGDTTKTFLNLGASHIIAIEPFLDAWTCLKLNCPTNLVDKVKGAAGDGRFISLTTHPVAPGMRYVENGGGHKTIRLDLILVSPDLIKIDVEGFEPAVLGGAERTITKWKPALLIECFPDLLSRYGWNVEEHIEKPLKDWGYKLRKVGDSNIRWDLFAILA